MSNCCKSNHLVSQWLQCVSACLKLLYFFSLLLMIALFLSVVVPSLRLMALLQAECVSPVTVTHLVPSRLTVTRLVSVVVSRASPDPNVTAAHEDFSTSKRGAAHVSTDKAYKLVFYTLKSFDFSISLQNKSIAQLNSWKKSKHVNLFCIYTATCNESNVSYYKMLPLLNSFSVLSFSFKVCTN